MQALYAFFQSENQDLGKGERELLNSIHKIYDLYIYLLALIIEIHHCAEGIIEERRNKRLPTEDDLNPSLKFVDNLFIAQLLANVQLKKELAARKINWQGEGELIKKIYNAIKASEWYVAYMADNERSYQKDNEFIVQVFHEIISDFELLHHFFEEKNIHWGDDIWFVNAAIVRTIESFTAASGAEMPLLPLYKDPVDDRQFAVDLFHKTILSDQVNQQLIADKTQNWEVERIALMDVLLMKMAITEILNFNNIPVKVTLNEYIEISKQFSTPKSKLFINGILDKLVLDFKSGNKFQKTGRGLME